NGFAALASNTTGSQNTANGYQALLNNTTGVGNTANGYQALNADTTAGNNTADGYQALYSNTTGFGANTATGYQALYSNTTGFYKVNEGGTILPLYINSNGQLGTMSSSRRFKEEIKPMDEASDAILALKPMTFRYKKEIDPDGVRQFGLVAEEVAKVNPDLVA